MDEPFSSTGGPDDEAPEPPARRPFLLRALLALVSLVLCVSMLFVTLPGRWFAPLPVPVTGPTSPAPFGEPVLPPGEPGLPPGHPTIPPGSEGLMYRVEAQHRLAVCYDAFHSLLMLEQMASREPGLVESGEYRTQARGAVADFRQQCEPLGSMPEPPPLYSEVDHWLKLAAGKIPEIETAFTGALETPSQEAMRGTAGSLVEFMEYTHNAETALDSLDLRRHI